MGWTLQLIERIWFSSASRVKSEFELAPIGDTNSPRDLYDVLV
jgi:hypothetical protein